MISKSKVVIAGVGEYDGHTTSILGTEQHMCGLQGYNPMLGDTCPRCDESARHGAIMEAAKEYLRKRGVLSEHRV